MSKVTDGKELRGSTIQAGGVAVTVTTSSLKIGNRVYRIDEIKGVRISEEHVRFGTAVLLSLFGILTFFPNLLVFIVERMPLTAKDKDLANEAAKLALWTPLEHAIIAATFLVPALLLFIWAAIAHPKLMLKTSAEFEVLTGDKECLERIKTEIERVLGTIGGSGA